MKNVLITGGTRGIGRALVEEYLKSGERVAFVYRRSEKEAKELEALGAFGFRYDLSQVSGLDALCASVAEKFGGIDVFVGNAGVASFGTFDTLTDEEWARVRTVDLDAQVLLTKRLIPAMIRKKEGRIVYISSMWGQVGASCEVAYSAAKAGLIGLTKALAKELGPSGVTVNCICPGVIDTEMNASLGGEALEELKNDTPLGRLGSPADIAKLCVFLTGEGATFITGQIIGVNGGFVIN